MELEARLRAFSGFVRRGSFSGAADELRISQPAISKHIADMERGLGVKLIDRRARALTPAGELLAAHVLRAEALLRQAAHGLASLREPMSGALTIVASGTPGTYVLPEIVAEFQQRHPGVRVHFELATSAEVIKAVRSHRAEIGVSGGFVAAPEIEAEPLIEDEIVIVGPPSFAGRRVSGDTRHRRQRARRSRNRAATAAGASRLGGDQDVGAARLRDRGFQPPRADRGACERDPRDHSVHAVESAQGVLDRPHQRRDAHLAGASAPENSARVTAELKRVVEIWLISAAAAPRPTSPSGQQRTSPLGTVLKRTAGRGN
jgi:DNA-binding transcriptional LysR family regulator